MTKDPKHPNPKHPNPKSDSDALSADELEAVRGGIDMGAKPDLPPIPGFPGPTFPDLDDTM